MDCDLVRETISANADGEEGLVSDRSLHDHLAECPECQEWMTLFNSVFSRPTLQAAEQIPDLTASIMANSSTPRRVVRTLSRITLAAVAINEIFVSIGVLFSANSHYQLHITRHAETLNIGLAIGLLLVAWQPLRAFAFVQMMLVVAVMSTVIAIIDIRDGHTLVLSELRHVFTAIALVLVWLLSGKPRPSVRR